MSEKRSMWMMVGIISLVVINLLGWGRYNYQLAVSGFTSEEFLVNWVAARELVFEGRNPYDSEVTRLTLSYLETRVGSDHEAVAQFTSPLYTLFLIFPFAMVNEYEIAQALWMSLEQVLLILLIVLSVFLGNVKPGRLTFVLIVVSTFLSYHSILPVLQGSTILLAGLFLILSLIFFNQGRYELAGVFIGLTTIQMPYMILPAVLFLIWTIIHRKRAVLFWFVGSLILLSVLGVFMVPEWPGQYLRILFNYTLFYPASSPGAAFRVWWPGIGNLLAWVLAIFSASVLGIEWLSGIKRDFRWLIWGLSLTLVLLTWTGIPVLPQNLAILVLPLIIYTGTASERWGKLGSGVAMISIFILFIWEWWLVIGNIDNTRMVDDLDLLFPLPVICLMGLYWVRWVFIRPKLLMLEDLRSSENDQ